jgi:hypothetical protein
LFENWRNYILEDNYLHHRGDVLLALHQVLNQLLLMWEPFLILLLPVLAGPTGRGSGGTMPLSGITPTIHHPVTQSNVAIKVIIIS